MEHKSPRGLYVNATSNNTPTSAGATVAPSCGRPLAPPDRLVRALPALRRLTRAPCSSDHTPPSRPEVPPSTACTPGQRWRIPAGPDTWRATKTVTALPQPLASSMAPHAPFPREQVASGVQARSTVVQGECCGAEARAQPRVNSTMAPSERLRGLSHPGVAA
jgi:hypothetical protein